MANELTGFTYAFLDKQGQRTLLLLHGTGGDEHDLFELGERLDPNANLLAPRGRVQESGLNRFFKRHAEGVLDMESLAEESRALASFLDQAAAEHALSLSDVTAVGYSNGANIALHLVSTQPDLIKTAILFRPMQSALAEDLTDMSGVRILIAAGEEDELEPVGNMQPLKEVLRDAGASVVLHTSAAGHHLQEEDLEAAERWLSEYIAR